MQSRNRSVFLLGLVIAVIIFSPTHKAHASTEVTEDIVTDTTWSTADSPYIISNSIHVSQGATLTISAGVIVQFDYGTEIDVEGTVNANSASDKIYFTSLSDSTIAGSDTTNTDMGFEAISGDYEGFIFENGSSGIFSNVDMFYADTAISASNAALVVTDSIFSSGNAGIAIENGAIGLLRNSFSNNSTPVSVSYATNFTHSGNVFTDNVYNGIGMTGDIYGSDYTFTGNDAPYILFSNPQVSEGNTLTFDAGVTVQSDDIHKDITSIGGTLSLLGTSDQTITFEAVDFQMFNHAVATLRNVNIRNIHGIALQIWDNATVTMDAVNIDTVSNDAIDIFNSAHLDLSNSTISNFGTRGAGIVVFNNAVVIAKQSVIDAGGDGIVAFNHASLDADHLTIKNCNDAGIISFGSETYDNSVIKLRNSEITANGLGMYPINYTTIDISRDSIHSNGIGVLANDGFTYDFSNNWWGDSTGPHNTINNPSGVGNEVSDGIVIDPWLRHDPMLPQKTPVLIVPGVLGTEISKPTDNGPIKLWLDLVRTVEDFLFGDTFMDPLQFNNDLTPSDDGLVLGDVIRNITGDIGNRKVDLFNYTDALILDFQDQGYMKDQDLFLFPYDWRYGVSEDAINQLKQKIVDIIDQTGSEKVDIVAHSTGGLLVKKYIVGNPSDHHIDRAVFVGVPNTGAPKAVKALVEGDSFGVPFLDQFEMKKIAKNLPVVYDLTPSQQYYNTKGSYIKIVDQHLFTSTSRFLNFEQANTFLAGDHQLNSQALSSAENLHTADFDNFDMRTVGVNLSAIDGCKAGTIGKVVEVRSIGALGNTTVSYNAPIQTAGDGTVPLESATNLPIDQDHKYFALKANHSEMLSQEGIRQEIVNILSGSSLSTKDNAGRDLITQDISQCKLHGRAISVYSPLSIDITDQDGNHAGLASGEVSIENTIANADYEIMGDHKFAYLPDDEGQTYTITVKGTDKGTFTVTDASIVDNEIIQTQVFKTIPVTTALSGNVYLGSPTTLFLDTDGDGEVDQRLMPSFILNAEQSKDFNPQEIPEPKQTDTNINSIPPPITQSPRGAGGGFSYTAPIQSTVFQLPTIIPSIDVSNNSQIKLPKLAFVEPKDKPLLIDEEGEEFISSSITANAVTNDGAKTVNKKVIIVSFGLFAGLIFVARKYIK